MRKNYRMSVFVCVGLIVAFQLSAVKSVHAQVVPDSYRNQMQQEYSRFVDSINDDFLRYLQQLWTEYQLFEGEMSPRSVKPGEQPRIDTMDLEGDTLKVDRQLPYGDFTGLQENVEEDEFVPHAVIGTIPKRNYLVTFYGRKLNIAVPDKVANITLSGVRERQVARFWKKLVETHAEQSVAALDQQRRNLYLGDWGLLELVRCFSSTVYPDYPNEQVVLSVFLLASMHYNVRIGRMDERLVMLVNTGSRLYNVPYLEIGSVRYYAVGKMPHKGRINTYEHQMDSANHPIDMHLNYSPRLGGALSSKKYNCTFYGRKMRFNVNQPLMDFYCDYPQTELSIYATAAMEEALAASLERELRPVVDGEKPVKALNILLEFMQQNFRYQTDLKQFGHEKNFFGEENFYYPANDCEDRAVLFARLVRMLLGYDVVLLEYDNHVAAAVNVPDCKVNGCHMDIKGRRYMVCDPTCLGATVGDLSRKYRNKKPNIILTR